MRFLCWAIVACSIFFSCSQMEKPQTGPNTPVAKYFNYGDSSVQTAGIRMIPIKTPVGEFKVWTKRFGNNPRIKVLLLHGGPAAGHEYMECFESFFPKEGFAFYEYDQLGAPYSDQRSDSSLWTIDRYVDEVEQVRKVIGAGNDNVYVVGSSWRGILGRLANWDIKNRLKEIKVPTLMVGAKFDTMDPNAMEEQSKMVKHGRYLYCPNGSHLCMWDDQKVFMSGVIKFIKDVDEESF